MLPQDKAGSDSIRARKTEFRLVYRTLRLISDLALAGFYSDVCVQGKDNVRRTGALILCPCHHNELLDIATISATTPHRRIISYWAKASLFRNPISRFILESAGSIPVSRAPRDSTKSKAQQELFSATHALLASGGALGVFPEGTSYTLPRIVQVKEGAARAALEFVKYVKENGVAEEGDEDMVQVVPVGIVPTDKAQYRSRVYVEYGKPISLAPYIRRLAHDDDEARLAIQDLTQIIECELLKLTINAPDWNTLYAALISRDMLWGHEKNVPLDSFVVVSQSLVDLFSDDESDSSLPMVKNSLLRYHALLHRTGLSHMSLPSSGSYLKAVLKLVPYSVPFALSLPVHISHLPGYVLGTLAMRKLGGDEEEAQAQYGAIIGGVGVGIGTATTGWLGLRMAKRLLETGIFGRCTKCSGAQGIVEKIVDPTILAGGKAVVAMITRVWSGLGRTGDAVCVLGLAWLLCKVHNRIIDANYARFQRIRATFTVLSGLLSPRLGPYGWTDPVLLPYLTTPSPPANPFVSARTSFSQSETGEGKSTSKHTLSTRKLVKPLLQARKEASEALGVYLRGLEAKIDRGRKRGGEDEGYESVDEDMTNERNEKRRSKKDILVQLRSNGAKIDRLP